MKRVLRILPLICCVPVFMSCRVYYEEPVELTPIPCIEENDEPSVFYASSGPLSFKNETLKWVSTQGGSIELNQVRVIRGAYTDKDLYAECSELGSVCIGGELWLENCCLCGTSKTEGGAWIVDSKVFAELDVGETLHAENSRFYQDITVNGNVDAKNTLFEMTLQAAAAFIQLDQVHAGSIVVCPTDSPFDSQVICIKNKSIVQGDIHFTSCRGKIVLDPTSHIQGQVYGGTIIKPFNYNYDFRYN